MHVMSSQKSNKDITVAGFYYDFLAQQEQTTTNVIGSILK